MGHVVFLSELYMNHESTLEPMNPSTNQAQMLYSHNFKDAMGPGASLPFTCVLCGRQGSLYLASDPHSPDRQVYVPSMHCNFCHQRRQITATDPSHADPIHHASADI